jgi:hypothetical protein
MPAHKFAVGQVVPLYLIELRRELRVAGKALRSFACCPKRRAFSNTAYKVNSTAGNAWSEKINS